MRARTSFRVRGKIFATVAPDGLHLHIFVGDEDREPPLELHPEFLEKLAWGGKVVGVRATLAKADAEVVKALEQILESQRHLYNAALEERIGAYRKAGVTRTYFDQCKALTNGEGAIPRLADSPVKLQRATLKRLDQACRGFFRRVAQGGKPGFPRFRGKGWFSSFGFAEFAGITLKGGRLRFKGMPGSLRVHLHRELRNVLAAA